MIRKKRIILCVIAAILIFIIINNFSFQGHSGSSQTISVLAHRGMAQTFDIGKVKWDTNTAAIIYKPEHGFLENTIPSMMAAFDYGADLVEFDIRTTKDKKLVVFHDYLVDYRTENKGNVSDYTLEELQKMDIGYGYTYDNGNTFPFRSKGVGLMPSFDDVLKEFPQKEFLIHIKDNGPEIGNLLIEKFREMNEETVGLYSIYGNDEAIALIKKEYPEMKAMTAQMLKKALIQYLLVGWTGYTPQSIRNMEIHIPIEYTKLIWGWPAKFLDRMNKAGSRVVLVRKIGPWTGGFDSIEEIKDIPAGYNGYIMTDRIDRIQPF